MVCGVQDWAGGWPAPRGAPRGEEVARRDNDNNTKIIITIFVIVIVVYFYYHYHYHYYYYYYYHFLDRRCIWSCLKVAC